MVHKTIHKTSFIASDFLAALVAWLLFYTIRHHLPGAESEVISRTTFIHGLLAATCWVLLYGMLGAYSRLYRQSRVKEIFALARVSLAGSGAIFFGLLLGDQGMQNFHPYFNLVAAYLGIHFLLAAFSKTANIMYHQAALRKGKVWFNTLLVGSGEKAREVFRELDKNNHTLGYHIIGYVEAAEPAPAATRKSLPLLGNCSQLPGLVKQYRVEEMVVALDPAQHRQIESILACLEGLSVRISILPDLYQILLGAVKVNHVFGTPLIEIKQPLMPVWQAATKRAADILLAALGLVFLLPLLMFVALLVKLSSPGPVLYRQERIGKGGVPFRIYKFRSMYGDAEINGPALSSDADPRVTPWGRVMRKVHLDELPQLYNVFCGHMSLVGPRPERQYFIDRILEKAPHYKHLLRVRPGITSLGLVKYGYAQNVEEMVRRMSYDIIYIENMSLAMDFRVLLYTIKVIMEGRGK